MTVPPLPCQISGGESGGVASAGPQRSGQTLDMGGTRTPR